MNGRQSQMSREMFESLKTYIKREREKRREQLEQKEEFQRNQIQEEMKRNKDQNRNTKT
jgi:hypothetical protein